MRLTIYICLIAFTSSIFTISQAQTIKYSFNYDDFIFFHWKGGLTPNSITLKVFPLQNLLEDLSPQTYLALYTKSINNGVQEPNIIQVKFEREEFPVTNLKLESLTPNTKYFYSFIFTQEESFNSEKFLEIYLEQPPQEFSFQTLGEAFSPFNFTFASSSCAETGSNSSIFSTLKDLELKFFLHLGDLHYMNVNENQTERFYNAYYQIFSSTTQKPFFQNTPMFYVWDDHDFGSDNSNGLSNAKPASNIAYKKFVPYDTLKNYLPVDDSLFSPDDYLPPEISGPYGIFRSFIVGRCLFIIMDLRSFKDIEPEEVLGAEQTIWLENQLRFAGKQSQILQIFLIGSFPWIHVDTKSEWRSYKTAQEQIADWIEEYIYDNNKEIIMLSGDAHMLAFDDGSNNIYGHFPVVQAASLDRAGHCKGGPYSHGIFTGRDHYGLIQVIDNGGDKICVTIKLKEKHESLITYDTCKKDFYPKKQRSCPLIVIDNPSNNSIYWKVLIAAIIISAIFILYKTYKQEDKEKVEDRNKKNYTEMTIQQKD